MVVVDLPPPPAPVVARIEASFPLPAAPPLYEYLSAMEGELPPARQLHRPAGLRCRSGQLCSELGSYALANPINVVLDRLGYSFRTLLQEIRSWNVIQVPVTETSEGGESGGLGEGSPNPVPTGDPIPVGGGGGPTGG